MQDPKKWHRRWFSLVDVVASWSKDPSTKVGAVIIPKNSDIPIIGWNGFPRKMEDSTERYENRELKYKLIVHAETNAILNAARNGVDIRGGSLYVSFCPCNDCAKFISQSGIEKVYAVKPSNEILERWGKSFKLSKLIFNETEIEYQEIET